MEASEIRKKFAIPEDVIYLNCSTMGPQLRAASDKGIAEVKKKESPWLYTREDFFEHVAELQMKMAQLLNAKPENIALTPSVSYGISTAAKGVLHYSEPGEILILDHQFPSNVYPWLELENQGFKIQVLQRDEKRDLTNQVLEAINVKTKVVSLGQCHWADGQMINIEILGQELKSRSITFVVDGIQSVGVVPTDVQKNMACYFAGGMYKWLLGPYGLSYLYVHDDYCEAPALDSTWMSRVGAEDFSQLTNYSDNFVAGAGRYHMGGKSSFIHVAIANESVQFLLDLGVENIQQAVKEKTARLATFFKERQFEMVADDFRSPHILSVKHPLGSWSEKIQNHLLQNKVMVSYRGDFLRISPNIFNTDLDLERFENILGEIL